MIAPDWRSQYLVSSDACVTQRDGPSPSTGFDSVSLAECVLPDEILNAPARTVIPVD